MTKKEMTFIVAKQIALMGFLESDEARQQVKGMLKLAEALGLNCEEKVKPLARYFWTLSPEEVRNMEYENVKHLIN